MNRANASKDDYVHIVVCYSSPEQPWDINNPRTHVTLRKGYHLPLYNIEGKSTLDSVAEILRPHVNEIIDRCPKTFVCKDHAWKPDWWASPGFMGAHKYLLEKVHLSEEIPFWLIKDIKKSDDPVTKERIYREAYEKYGTPWDGEDCFHMISHMTKVGDLHQKDDVLKYNCIAVFLGKYDRGELNPETPHVILV